jgi:hypothetical protein
VKEKGRCERREDSCEKEKNKCERERVDVSMRVWA